MASQGDNFAGHVVRGFTPFTRHPVARFPGNSSVKVIRDHSGCLWFSWYRADRERTLHILLLGLICLLPYRAGAQSSPPPGIPPTMRVCARYCATWTWNNGHYDGIWDNGARGRMMVKSFTPGSVVIERRDANGLFAVYKGKIARDGHSIVGGTVTFLSNHPVNSLAFTATWAAAPVGTGVAANPIRLTQTPVQSENLPSAMRFCDFACFTLTLNKEHYDAVKDSVRDGTVASIYTVVSFTPESVVLNRWDTNGGSAILKGRMSPVRDRVVDGEDNLGQQSSYDSIPTDVAIGTWAGSYGPSCRSETLAPGLTPRAVMKKMCSLQMVDVRVPTTDGRLLILPRYTQPEKEHRVLLHPLRLQLPAQPTPKIIQQGAKYVAEVKTL